MEKEIGKIKKNDDTDIVLRIDDFGGRTGLTIREFVTGERYTGFTKSGVRIMAPNFSKFKEMINSISDEDMKEPEQPTGEGEKQAPAEGVGEAETELPPEQEKIEDY